MKVRFFAITTTPVSKPMHGSNLRTFLLIVPENRHWRMADLDCPPKPTGVVIWEKELTYEDALSFSDMSEESFGNLILTTTTTNKAVQHDA